MSKGKRRQTTAPRSRRQEPRRPRSLAIPVLVAMVLVAVVVAVIVSFENRRSEPGFATVPTAAPLPTNSIPYPDVARISIQEAQQRAAAGEAVIVDVRSAASYAHSHVAGAISAPETEIEKWIDELPRDVDLVLY